MTILLYIVFRQTCRLEIFNMIVEKNPVILVTITEQLHDTVKRYQICINDLKHFYFRKVVLRFLTTFCRGLAFFRTPLCMGNELR